MWSRPSSASRGPVPLWTSWAEPAPQLLSALVACRTVAKDPAGSHGWPAPSCLPSCCLAPWPRPTHRAQSSPSLVTLLPHALGCRPGQLPLLPPLASPEPWGAGGGSAPCLPPWLQEVHCALLLLALSTLGVPCTSAAQTSGLFCRIKSIRESASPALWQSARGTGLRAQRCPPKRLLAWLGCARATGLFQGPRYSLSWAGSCRAETGMCCWVLGPGGIATLCRRDQEHRGVWGATGLPTPLPSTGEPGAGGDERWEPRGPAPSSAWEPGAEGSSGVNLPGAMPGAGWGACRVRLLITPPPA